MSERAEAVEIKMVEIRLINGDTINARLGQHGSTDLDGLHRTLQASEFIRVGDDTIVRSSDVRSIQVKDGSGGLLDSLRSRVSGDGDRQHESPGRSEQARRSSYRPQPRLMRAVETRPFFLTSEFALAFLAWVGLLITTLASDSVDAWSFWLFTAAIATGYMVTRGFAKANTPSQTWDPREEWQPSR